LGECSRERKDSVIKRISLLLVAALLAATMVVATAAPAFAVSPSQEQCEAQGGTFDRTGGEVQCVTVEEGKNPKFTDTETTTGQGNISNKQQQSDVCEPTGSEKCPPGQF
jgi:hypothetical protein